MAPVAAYLSIPEVMRVCKETGVTMIHPGYGFLSESPELAKACEENDITFVGPSSDLIRSLGHKTAARELAASADVPVVPGSDGAIKSPAEARCVCMCVYVCRLVCVCVCVCVLCVCVCVL
jgi:pyruvate carboxylase